MRTLIITEKPKVSQKIAQALAPEYARKGKEVAYYEVKLDGREVVIASAAGHLYSLAQVKASWGYPVFDIKWAPLHTVEKGKAYVKKYIDTLASLAKEADEFYIATDYDIEGELLGYNALRFACMPAAKDKKFLRMRFSTLTGEDLLKAFENPGEVDLALVDAGEARHIMDWYWGINTSRALTQAAKQAIGQFTTLSAGRVQTPALAILVKREREIAAFKQQTYWEVYADIDAKGTKVKAEHKDGRIFERGAADGILARAIAKEALLGEVKREEVKKQPPFPFDLGALQTEAYRLFGYVPKRTQEIAQSLYEGGYISYPRTSSQKLPGGIGYEKILRALAESPEFKDAAGVVLKKEVLRPREGPKTDPAHPAIYPTGLLPKELGKEEEKLYKLTVHRFIAVFGDPMVRETVKVGCEISGEEFRFGGSRTMEAGWGALYPYIKFKDLVLPLLEAGERLPVLKVYPEEKVTEPPPRYNPASLLKELEKRGLGTKATRAEVVDTLYRREYARGNPMEVTELGSTVVKALEEHAPAIISEELTKRFEEKLQKIQSGGEVKERVLEEAREELTRILEEMKGREGPLGQRLGEALVEKERRKNIVGKCPKCSSDLRIIKSRRTGKIFIGCSNYPNCSTSFPLPQKDGIKTTTRACRACNLPMVSIPFGRKRILSCVDMNCKSKERLSSGAKAVPKAQ